MVNCLIDGQCADYLDSEPGCLKAGRQREEGKTEEELTDSQLGIVYCVLCLVVNCEQKSRVAAVK
uniref:Uncharacterized protein n=1 Tax=Anguilla anguilla TaxID=7936 RepID=A0A0E9T263_ANGAN